MQPIKADLLQYGKQIVPQIIILTRQTSRKISKLWKYFKIVLV